jgi:hypothetical protein
VAGLFGEDRPGTALFLMPQVSLAAEDQFC